MHYLQACSLLYLLVISARVMVVLIRIQKYLCLGVISTGTPLAEMLYSKLSAEKILLSNIYIDVLYDFTFPLRPIQCS